MSTICGVDVSGDRLDAHIRPLGLDMQVERTVQGVGRLRRWCEAHGVDLVVMEATGGLERLAFALLWEAGLPCAVVNPRQVRRFADAMGRLEKTDRIDAEVIAAYAEACRVEPRPPCGPGQRRLAALVTRLGQLTAARVAQENQRRRIDEPMVLASIDAVLATLKAEIARFEDAITALIGADPLWREIDAAFRQIKGVGPRTVARLIADMPEIGTLNAKQGAKLTGLAPLARDSGKLRGRRSVRGGRAGVRSTLYVVAGIVARHEPDFIAFRQRLLDAGKPPKLIRIAVARKLLVRLNAKARDIRNTMNTPIAA